VQQHIHTGFSLSKDTYRSSIDKLRYGISQENCASPILWALINHIVLAAQEEKIAASDS
jgi:hypothetical protein